jgi:hypothetical protein
MRLPFLAFLALPFVVTQLPGAQAQGTCNGWVGTFEAIGPDAAFEDFVTFDDGGGPDLYAVGAFHTIGGVSAHGVARWDGASWSPLGGGRPGVNRLTVFDDGNGPRLYAGGGIGTPAGTAADAFSRWNGTAWEAVPGFDGSAVRALQVHDDGSGPALYVAGSMLLPGSPGMRSVLRWDGTTWTDASAGLPAIPHALAVHDDGSGPALYAGLGSSGWIASPIRRWNGSAWVDVSTGLTTGNVRALESYTSGGGAHLYAAGSFATGSGNNGIVRFDGTTWSGVAGGLTKTGSVPVGSALAVHDDGSGPRLVAGGLFDAAGGSPASAIASFDGATWRPFDHGFSTYSSNVAVMALASHDDGGGAALYAGGFFSRSGRTSATNAARWRNGEWSAVASGDSISTAAQLVRGLDDGSGPALYACGVFDTAGSTVTSKIARWDGGAWSPLGDSFGTDKAPFDLAVHTHAGTTDLYAVGDFTQIGGVAAAGVARWDGQDWWPLGAGIVGRAFAVVSWDDGTGPALYVGGSITSAGGVNAHGVARWNGTSWSALGTGTNGMVRDLVVHDDGSGPALYACGTLTLAGGIAVPRIARWDGTAWSAVGSNIAPNGTHELFHLAVHDDGSGPSLYVSGDLLLTGPLVFHSITRWDGTTWTGIRSADVQPSVLQVFHDGTRSLLGSFRRDNTLGLTLVDTWDGQQWAALPGGIEGVLAMGMTVLDMEGDGAPDLYVCGQFPLAGGAPAHNIARFALCGTPATIVCAGDGTGTACPCGNTGASGHGCANSLVAAGASLATGGIASISADTLELSSQGLTGSFALHVQGTQVAGGSGVPFGDGLACAGGTVTRLVSAPVVNGSASTPAAGGTPLSLLGAVPGPGATRVYQTVYRNQAIFCTGDTTNTTNGVSITWSL